MKARHKIRVCSVGVSPGGDRVTAQKKHTGRAHGRQADVDGRQLGFTGMKQL